MLTKTLVKNAIMNIAIMPLCFHFLLPIIINKKKQEDEIQPQ